MVEATPGPHCFFWVPTLFRVFLLFYSECFYLGACHIATPAFGIRNDRQECVPQRLWRSVTAALQCVSGLCVTTTTYGTTPAALRSAYCSLIFMYIHVMMVVYHSSQPAGPVL